jgi:deoxyribose-phosphate aldolase
MAQRDGKIFTAISKKIDATLLKPNATIEEVLALVGEAQKYGYRGVCVPPYHVPLVKSALSDSGTEVSSVVGFPLGFVTKPVKLYEIETLLASGATEVEVVVNIGAYLSGHLEVVEDELSSVVDVAKTLGANAVKIIIEIGYLNLRQVEELSRLVADSGADYIKTSTGFGPRGVTTEDVIAIREAVGERLKIKASGGIRTLEQALELMKAGASLIGTSSARAIVEEELRGA